jgi:hypothetical protein
MFEVKRVVIIGGDGRVVIRHRGHKRSFWDSVNVLFLDQCTGYRSLLTLGKETKLYTYFEYFLYICCIQ